MAQIKELAEKYRSLKDQIDKLGEEKSSLQKEFDELRNKLLPDAMEDMGIENVKIEGVGKVALYAEMYASIPADHKPEAYEWLEENGYGDLIASTVNSSTFKAFCKEQMKKGVVLPEDLFKITPFTQARITKS